MAGEHPQAAAGRWQTLQVEYQQPDRTQNALDDQQRQIGPVAVVDAVEPGLIHHPEQMREVECHDAIRPQNASETGGEAEQIRNFGQHAVRHDKIRAPVSHRDFHRGFRIQQGTFGGHAVGSRQFRQDFIRFDA